MMQEKVKALIEKRIIEATRKRMSPKMALIARELGNPIIASSAFNNYLPDVWALPNEDIIYDPTHIETAEEWSEETRGWVFDGLKFGINLNIVTMYFDDHMVEVKTTYNGYLVFAEIEGHIKAYAPFPAWEEAMDMFYDGALSKEDQRKKKEQEDKHEDLKKRFANFWKSFRMLWGY